MPLHSVPAQHAALSRSHAVLRPLIGCAIALPSSSGALFATFAVTNIASSAWTGYASDKLGRRPVLIWSTFGVASGFLATALAPTVFWLFVARGWLGFWSGVGSTARAYIADVTDTAKRTDLMGKASALMMVGYATGAPIGGMLALCGGYRVPFFVGAFCSAAGATYCWVRLPSPSVVQELMHHSSPGGVPSASTAAAPDSMGNSPRGLVPGAVPRLIMLCVYLVCTCISQGFLMVVLPLFLMVAFGWGAPTYACIISIRAAAAFVQMYGLGRVVPLAGGHVPLALIASVVGAIGAILSVFAAVGVDKHGEAQVSSSLVTVLFLAGLAVQYSVTGFATGVAAPAISTLGDSSVQGRLMGLHSGLEVGGRMAGQILVAVLYEASPLYACALPIVANVLAAVSMGVAIALERHQTS